MSTLPATLPLMVTLAATFTFHLAIQLFVSVLSFLFALVRGDAPYLTNIVFPAGLHHAMIDRTWAIWQLQDFANRQQVIAVSH
jgi:hypothetical protein